MSATCLYRCHDVHGHLLYVGITEDLATRFNTHESKSGWYPLVYDVREEWFPNRPDAEAAEIKTIRTEHPQWNVVHRPPVEYVDGYAGKLARVINDQLAQAGISFHHLHKSTGIPRSSLARKLTGEHLDARDIGLIANLLDMRAEELVSLA